MTLLELLNVVYSDQGMWILYIPEYDEYYYKNAHDIPKQDLYRKVIVVEAYKKDQLYVKIK